MKTSRDLDRVDRVTLRAWRVANLVGWWFVGAAIYNVGGVVVQRVLLNKIGTLNVGWRAYMASWLVSLFAATTAGWVVGGRVYRAPGFVGAATVLLPSALFILCFLALSPGSDLPSVMASLERQSPDLVISAGSFDDEVVLARALVESGLLVKAVGLAAAAMHEFPQALGIHAEGFLGPSQWEPRLACHPDFGPSPDEATEGIRAQGAAPDYPAAQAYAACLIAQRCLEEAGVTA